MSFLKTAAVFFSCGVVSQCVSAEILTVDDDGGADYERIQDAINDAVNGDVVSVLPGNYPEVIDFLGKSIEVKSTLGPMATSIKAPADSVGSTVTFQSKENSGAVLSGFKIGGGSGTLIQDPVFGLVLCGGGVGCFDSNPTIENCVFLGMHIEGFGGGMVIMRSAPHVEHCTFEGNQSEGHGGGIYVLDYSLPTIVDCHFIENVGLWGGAMTITTESHATITGCTFVGNQCANVGGAIYVRSSSDPTFTNCVFADNIQEGNPSAGGAAFTVYGSGNGGGPCYPTMTDCSFTNNVAMAYGGAVHAAYSGNLTLLRCNFQGNSAGAGGGGIATIGHDKAPTTVTIDGCTFDMNHCNSDGGAIHSRTTTVVISNCEVTENIAGDVPEFAGGCSFTASGDSSIMGSTICGNTSMQVAGAFIDLGGNTIESECDVSSCPTDLNGDGQVDGADLSALLGDWGSAGSDADFNGDGNVDGADLTMLLGDWGACA